MEDSRAPAAPPTPPEDPRSEQALPPFGSLEQITDLDEVTVRVLAPNASPMTLDGTNTYVIGAPGSGEAIVVDPGPDDEGHLDRVENVLRARDAAAVLVVVTHHHVDHAEAAARWAERFGCAIAARRPDVAGADGVVLSPGDTLARAGIGLEVVATPGHCADHLAFRVGTGSLLTGDHVLGRGTSVVAHPDGDLTAYLDSLRRTLDLGPDALYPGHGPVLTEDPRGVIRYYLAHREYRLEQIRAVLASGPHTPREIVEVIYADVDERLWPAAEASTRAALETLEDAGEVATGNGEASLLDTIDSEESP